MDTNKYYELIKTASREEVAKIHAEFKAELLAELEIDNHPKAELLWSKAWELGHSSGYADVAYYAHELVDLIK